MNCQPLSRPFGWILTILYTAPIILHYYIDFSISCDAYRKSDLFFTDNWYCM